MKTDLLKIKGLSGKDRMASIVTKLEEFHIECLDHQFADSLDVKKKNGGGVNEDKVGKQKSKYTTQGITFFSKPRCDENCRICKMYDSKGDTRNLYDDP